MTSISAPDRDLSEYRSWAEVDHTALRANARFLREHAEGAAVMAVVKANAYGHGLPGVLEALAGEVQMFGLANLTEARSARAILESLTHLSSEVKNTPLVILGAALPSERVAIALEGFIPVVSSVAEAQAFASHGPVNLHLAVDTGMGRMGAWEEEAIEVSAAIRALPNVRLSGICSHLPSADEDDAFTVEQLERFHRLATEISRQSSSQPLIHVENSAGALGFPNHAASLIRAGLALYGVSPREEFQPKFAPALTWKTRVLLARDAAPGRSVSYGRSFTTTKPTKIATLAVGYADGYQRQMSNHGAYVLIRGQRCPLLGRITMDQIMVDATTAGDIQPGEEVVLLGRQGDEVISSGMLAQWAGTIPWHIFTSLGNRVIRVPIRESAPFQTQNPR